MSKRKLIRITTIPLSFEKLLEGQLKFMSSYFEVTAVSSEKERLEAYGEAEQVTTYYLPLTRKITPFKDLYCILKLYFFLLKERPAIVHTHTPKAGWVGMVASYFACIPNRLHTVAGLPLMESKGLKRKILEVIEKLTYRFASKVYPNSNELKKYILRHSFTNSSKLKVIGEGSSNGIDINHFSSKHFTNEEIQERRISLGILKTDFVYVFVGRIVRDKGINELIEAFHAISSKHTNISLLLVGPYEDDLNPINEASRNEIATNPKIISTGYQNDVRIFFALSDALVFPSYREGFPNVVMQAGAMNLPVIASDINGCNEIITPNQNGLLIPIKNSKALQVAMEKLVANDSLYETLKSNSRKFITQRYERSSFWNKMYKEYKTLMDDAQ